MHGGDVLVELPDSHLNESMVQWNVASMHPNGELETPEENRPLLHFSKGGPPHHHRWVSISASSMGDASCLLYSS